MLSLNSLAALPLSIWLYVALGILGAILAGLANSSVKRLSLAAALTIIIIFVAFPFSTAVGFLSRQSFQPTLAALTPIFPILWLIPVAALIAIFTSFGNRVITGIVAIVAALISLLTASSWIFQDTNLNSIRPLNGLMEFITALVLAGLLILFVWPRKKLRVPLIVMSIIASSAFFFWLNSDSGHLYFPNSEGYYRILTPTEDAVADEIVSSYNDGLDALNKQRKGIGLSELEPITSLTALADQKLPREAADDGFRMVRPKESGYGVWLFFVMCGLLFGSGLMLLLKPKLSNKNEVAGALIFTGVVSALTPAFSATDFSFQRLVDGWPFLMNFLDRSWPPLLTQPEFDRFPLQEVASQMLLTVEIALVGTFLAALFAVPLSFLAARNITNSNNFMRTVFTLTRGFFNIDRGIDTLILALIFVAAVGLGPFAGVLAMAIHSIADLGKLYSESIENVDKGPIEALESVGAPGVNIVRWGILPQVLPLFVGWTLYRFEINFRVSIVLGLVGAGGIGFFIQEKMASGQYDQMVIAIIAIIIVVNIIDFISSWLRGRLV